MKYRWRAALGLALVYFVSLSSWAQDWNSFVVGKIDDIPNETVRQYLINTQEKNAYAEMIKDKLATLGVFSPNAQNIFWLPSIDVPVDDEEWRYLFVNDDMPADLLAKFTYTKGRKKYVKMLLHPYTTLRPEYIQLADRLGGFKFEFQAATTASVRSFVIWQTKKPREELGDVASFPRAAKDYFKGKVSIYATDIDGSRLNRAKKMVRASVVSHIFGEIPVTQQRQFGFEFEREVLVGVPAGTDAGFVVREGLAEMNGSKGTQEFSEPGFSLLYPSRLNKLAGRKSDPLGWIADNLFAPLARAVAYVLMEQGMLGENHTQNFDYVVDEEGMPTGRVILRDADAHRVNLTLRALKNQSLVGAHVIDEPFYYLKEAAFSATQLPAGGAMTLNSLMGYMFDSHDNFTFVTSIYSWCIEIKRFKDWCNRRTIRDTLLEKMAGFLSPYLGREIRKSEIRAFEEDLGNLGFMPLFRERMDQLTEESYKADLAKYFDQTQDQKILKEYFLRMEKGGRVRYDMRDSVNLREHFFVFEETPGAEHIRVYRKEPKTAGGRVFVGIAIPDKRDEVGYRRFVKSISTCGALLTQAPPIMNE